MRHRVCLDNKYPTFDLSKHNQSIPHGVANPSGVHEYYQPPASKFCNEKKTYTLPGGISSGHEKLKNINNKKNHFLNFQDKTPSDNIANGIFFAQPVTVVNDADNIENSPISSQTISNQTKEKNQFRYF